MRTFTTLIILLLFVQSSHGQTQKIDSLKKVLAKLPPEGSSYTGDTTRVRVLLGVGKIMVNPDSAIVFLDKAIESSKKIKWISAEAESQLVKGRNLLKKGFHFQSIDVLYSCLQNAEKIKENSIIALSYRYLGDNYLHLNNETQSLTYYQKSLNFFIKTKDKRAELICLNNIALAYQLLKQYPKALNTINNALKKNNESPKIPFIDDILLLNISRTYHLSGQYDLSLKTLNSTSMAKSKDNDLQEGYLAQMANVYVLKRDYSNALKYAKELESISSSKSNMIDKDIHEVYYKAYKGMGDEKNALMHYEKFITDKQKADEQEAKKKVASLKYEYDNFKKQEQIVQLDNSLINEKKVKTILLFGGGFLLLLGGFLFFSNRLLKNKNIQIENQRNEILVIQSDLEQLNESLEVKVSERTAELTEANQSLIRKNREIEEALYKGQSIERKRVASELHDNLGGTLSAIKWRLEGMEDDSMTLSEKLIYDSILGMLKDAYADLRLISHNLLPEELEKNGLKNSIQKLVNEINQSKKLEVWLSFRIDENLMDNKLKLELYSICLELLNNTLKHADATEVAINFFMRESTLFLQVLDDGKGMTLSKDGTGMGMKNINTRVESLNGKLKITPQEPKGTSVVVEINTQLASINS